MARSNHLNKRNSVPTLFFYKIVEIRLYPTAIVLRPIDLYHLTLARALQYMEPLLPAGSAVLFMPLVDGRVLYNTLHDKQHPIGVTYSDLYDCISI
jgi:acyloxyacyl hydrolase